MPPWRFGVLRGIAGASLLSFAGALAQDAGCSRLSIAGVRPGMSVDEVRRILRTQSAVGQVSLPDGTRASTEDFALPDGLLHVEYDGFASRQKSVRVVLVRQPLRQTEASVTALLSRAGEPIAGRDALVQGLQSEPVVWVDPMCDMVLTYRRRADAFFTEPVSTFLLLERLSLLAEDSPVGRIVREHAANAATAPPPAPVAAEPAPPPAPVVATPPPPEPEPAPPPAPVIADLVTEAPSVSSPPSDSPPQRSHYVEPVYPPEAKAQGVRGIVHLRIFVQRNGRVAIARMLNVDPLGYGFEREAIAAAERWRFRPATRSGTRVDATVDVVVHFPPESGD